IRGESESLEEAVRVAKQKQRADEDSVSSSKSAADAYLATNEEVQDLTDSLQKLIDTLNEVNGINQDAISANIDYQNTLRDVDEAIRNGAHGLDINTQAGADNMEMLLDLAESAWDAAEAQFNLDGNVQSFKGSLEASREALIQRAMDLGY